MKLRSKKVALGQSNLDLIKSRIDTVVNVVAGFFRPSDILPGRPEVFQRQSPTPCLWEIRSGSRGIEICCSVNYFFGGEEHWPESYSNQGRRASLGDMLKVCGALDFLLEQMEERFPQFKTYLQPVLEAAEFEI